MTNPSSDIVLAEQYASGYRAGYSNALREAALQDTSAAYNAAYDHGFRAGIEECARLVESTGLRNPGNIARDIRALKAALAPEQDK